MLVDNPKTRNGLESKKWSNGRFAVTAESLSTDEEEGTTKQKLFTGAHFSPSGGWRQFKSRYLCIEKKNSTQTLRHCLNSD